MKENPLQSKFEVEPVKFQGLTHLQKCRIFCSCECVFVSLLVFGIGCAHFVIFWLYNYYSIRFVRDGIWVFFAIGTLSWLRLLSFLVRVCIASHKDTVFKVKRRPTVSAIAHFNKFFDINGKYYLAKLYFAEAFEHVQQLYSLATIYVCLMPVMISSTVCIVLIAELLINIWATFRIASQEVRDRLILLDIFTDIFCLLFPLLYAYTSFGVPIPIDEMLFIMVYPSLSLLSKLNDVWEDYFNMDLQRVKQQRKTGRRSRRMSILNLSRNQETFDRQLKHFPQWMRCIFLVLNVGFVLFLASIVCVHFSTQPSAKECDDVVTSEIWEGCRLPVPFCHDLFVARCDCAVLEMTNYSQKALPGSFAGLSSLTKLAVYAGGLEQLPQSIGKDHKRLVVLTVMGNRLRSLPDSVVNLNLIFLQISNNRLRSLPDRLGNFDNLITLQIQNNQLKLLPDSVGNLNNLISLIIYNNQIRSFPDSIGKLKSLQYLYAWNNSLTLLPKSMGGMMSLSYVDFRHNHLDHLPVSASKWTNVKSLYLVGNPLCPNLDIRSNLKGAIGLCEPQCSVDCPADWLGDGVCDDGDHIYFSSRHINPLVKPKPNSGCNTPACEYDKGDCKN
jgi:hypothetical protein